MDRDPYFTTAKFKFDCPETGKWINKGDTIAFFPREGRGYHESSKSADIVRGLMFAKACRMPDADW